MSKKDLIPFNKRSKDEAKKMGSKGGKKSGEVRKKAKTFKELTQKLLSTPIQSDEKVMKFIKELFPDIKDKEITARFAMIIRQIEKAIKKGDSKAFEVIRDTAGEKPVNLLGNDPDNPFPESNTNIFNFSKLTDKELKKLIEKIEVNKNKSSEV